jgi:hypothetical protein
MTYFKVLYQHLPGDNEENHGQDSLAKVRKSKMLPLSQPACSQ